jgi:hypothetical protein
MQVGLAASGLEVEKMAPNFRGFVVKAAKLELRQDVSFVLASDIVPVIWFLYYTACTHD